MAERLYGSRDQWEHIAPPSLTNAELKAGLHRTSGHAELLRVPAVEDGREVELEVLWLAESERAAVAGPDYVFWTDAITIEIALQRWADRVARGARSTPR